MDIYKLDPPLIPPNLSMNYLTFTGMTVKCEHTFV